MRSLIFASALLAAVACATPHVVNDFNIPLQHTPVTPAVNQLAGDLFLVVTDYGLEAVNLTSKMVQWTNQAQIGAFPTAAFATTVGILVTVGEQGANGINIVDGSNAWSQPAFITDSTSRNIKFSAKGDDVAITTQEQVVALNAKTGAIIFQKEISSAIAANGLLYYINEDSQLVAEDIFKGVVAWTSTAAMEFESVLFANSMYVMATSSQEQASGEDPNTDTTAWLLMASNGNAKVSIPAVNGINEDRGTVTISGNNWTFVAGAGLMRLYTVDINSGIIISEVPYSGGGGNGGNGNGEHSVIRGNGMEIKVQVTPAMPASAHGTGFAVVQGPVGGPYTTVCPQTPSSSYQTTQVDNLEYYGDGLVKIGNLQGWVWFYIDSKNVCTMLGLNEMLPNWTPPASGGQVFKFGDVFVDVQERNVVGYKVVM